MTLAIRIMSNNSFCKRIDFPNPESYEVISFDVFDTCVFRKVLEPRDVFLLMEEELVSKHGRLFLGFSDLRFRSELEVAEKLWSLDLASEFGLEDIYRTLFLTKPALRPFEQEIREAELRTERAVTVPSDRALSYFKQVRKLGKKTIFITDVYLPRKHIEEVLEQCGYEGYDKLFVSCEVGTNKRSGKLFDLALSEMSVRPQSMIHIGDNGRADVTNARSRGMAAHKVPNALEVFRQSPHLKARYLSGKPKHEHYAFRATASDSLLCGLQKNYAIGGSARKDLQAGSSYDAGYQILGPYCYGFVNWTIRHAREKGIKDLYFVARDGWFLKKVFDEINSAAETGINSHYFYASRRALSLPMVSDIQKEFFDVFLKVVAPKEGHTTKLSHLLRALGLEVSDAVLKQSGFKSSEEPVDVRYNESDRQRFLALCAHELEQLSSLVKAERENYLEYLQISGVSSAARVALVDSGWYGSSQNRLQKLIGTVNPEIELDGFYISLHKDGRSHFNDRSRGHCYLDYGDKIRAFQMNAMITEALLCAPAKSLKRFIKKDGVLAPDFMGEGDTPRLHPHAEAIQAGALEFVGDYCNAPTQEMPVPSKYLIANLFEKFIKFPTTEEAFSVGCLPYANSVVANPETDNLTLAMPKVTLATFLRNPRTLMLEFRNLPWKEAYRKNHSSAIIRLFLMSTQKYYLQNILSVRVYNALSSIYKVYKVVRSTRRTQKC